MRIIISRKGFDSGAGGKPNPVLPSGRALSLPIPDARSVTRYGDVSYCPGDGYGDANLGQLVHDLTKGKFSLRYPCHLDPDIDWRSIPRSDNWRPVFGQTGAAQSHLLSQGVQLGDLFLFFGWYRDVEQSDGRWRYKKGAADRHIFYGWLQIGEILNLGADPAPFKQSHPWMADHPHMHRRGERLNTAYIATHDLVLDGKRTGLPGAGAFELVRPQHVLTTPDQCRRSQWTLPAWMHPDTGVRISYHDDIGRWSRDGDTSIVQSAMRGQEFVMDVSDAPGHREWLDGIFGLDRP